MSKFRIIFNGSLLPGFQLSQAEATLIRLFNLPTTQAHALLSGTKTVLNHEYSAEDALDLQSKLNQVGIETTIQKIEDIPEFVPIDNNMNSKPSSARPEKGSEPFNSNIILMTCPACKHKQEPADKCSHCGIDFELYNAGVVQNKNRNSALLDQWQDPEELEESPEHQLDKLLLFFVGKKGAEYFEIFKKFKDKASPKPKFKLSWNSAALFFPYWALYRRFWLGAIVSSITWFLIPLFLIIFSSYDILPHFFLYLGWIIFALNIIIWPFIANYLYYLLARRNIGFLVKNAPAHTIENDVIAVGGTDPSTVFAGIAFSLVFILFTWAVVDSLVDKNTILSVSKRTHNPIYDNSDPFSTPMKEQAETEKKIVKTKVKLRAAKSAINAWLIQHKTKEISSFKEVILDLELTPRHFQDGWGNEMQFKPMETGFEMVSAGADQLFGSADDLRY